MDIFGIGPLELILVLILALLIFGPNKLPEIAAKLGSGLRDMRKATREFSKELDETRQAIEGPIQDLKEVAEPLQTTGDALSSARDLITHPGKAIEGYVLGQYSAGSEAPAETEAAPTPAITAPDPAVSSALTTLDTVLPSAGDAPTAPPVVEESALLTTEEPSAPLASDETPASPAMEVAPAETIEEQQPDRSDAPIASAPADSAVELPASTTSATDTSVATALLVETPAAESAVSAEPIVAAPDGAAEPPAPDHAEQAPPAQAEPHPAPATATPVAPRVTPAAVVAYRRRHRMAPRLTREADVSSDHSGASSEDEPAAQD